MRKIEILLMGLAFVAFTSCGESNNTATENSESAKQTENPVGRDLTEAEKRGMRLMKSRQDSKRKQMTDKTQNMTSAYRYIVSSDEYPIFSNLVKNSRINKHIHGGDVTLLAPVDKAFEDYPRYKELLYAGNEDALDEFISYHVVNESMEYKIFSEGTDWQVHAGPTLELSREGGVYFGGAHVRSGSIETDRGIIIGMDDLIYFPKLEK